MRFKITGADPRTGKERTLTVMAATDADAERIARQSGMLVSSVREDAAPVAVAEPALEQPPEEAVATQEYAVDGGEAATQYAAPSTYAAPVQYATPSDWTPPDYVELLTGAKRLRGFATLTAVLAWIAIGGGVLLGMGILLVGVVGSSAAPAPGAAGGMLVGAIFTGILVALAPAAYGVVLLIISAMLKTQAAMALTLRDLARRHPN